MGFVGLSLGGSAALYLLLRRWTPSTRTVLAVALAVRAVVFPLAPTLSDDGYRYVWDGVVQAEGISPYGYRPSDPQLDDLQDSETYSQMNSAGYYSVYPPVSQLVFWLGELSASGGWYGSWLAIKSVIAFVELSGIVCLIRLVGSRRAALYAWHPLAVIEVAGQGHTEGLLVGGLGLFLLAVRRHPAWAGGALAWAGWVKLYPFALVPLLVRRWRGLTVFGVAGIALAWPYASASGAAHVMESLSLYFGEFDFYAAPYIALKSLLYPIVGETAGPVASRVLVLGWASAAALFFLTDDGTSGRARRIAVGVLLAYALASTTLHPWHLLPLLLILPLLQFHLPLYWLVSVSTTTYLAYLWPSFHGSSLLVGWGGAALLFLTIRRQSILQTVMRFRARTKWGRIRDALPSLRPGGRLLDLGAGEGWVGSFAAAERGVGLTSVDVVRYGTNGPGVRPITVYDGARLPYPDRSFDATLLVFVLHHAEDPRRVLQEALRVTDGPVLILETVAETARRKRWLERVDRWLNRVRSRGAMDEEPLDIRADADWRSLFADLGVDLQVARTWGGLHPQALYRLGHGATASSTDAAVAVRASTHRASS
jgi:SAM-dependent methyltransferase